MAPAFRPVVATAARLVFMIPAPQSRCISVPSAGLLPVPRVLRVMVSTLRIRHTARGGASTTTVPAIGRIVRSFESRMSSKGCRTKEVAECKSQIVLYAYLRT